MSKQLTMIDATKQIGIQDIDKYAKKRMAYDGSDNLEYLGVSVNDNAAEGDEVWMIWKFVYSGSNLTEINIANEKRGYRYSWTNRANYF